MDKEKAKKAIIILMAVFIALLCVKEYIDMKYYYINEKVITNFMSGTMSEKVKAKTVIIKNILTHWGDINRGGVKRFTEGGGPVGYEAMNLAVFKVNIKDKDDLLLALQIDDRLSLIGVYTKVGKKYAFLAKVDSFVDIKDIQPVKMEAEGRDLIAVRERIPLIDEICEDSTYIRIYHYDRNQFNIVLNVLERYNSFYNEFWDYPRLTESNWLMVTQKSDVLWENEYYPKITLKLWQTYGVSDEINAETIPDSAEFSIISRRDFTNVYNWSKRYNHFILFEGIDKYNGRKVAVIEDLAQSPFALAPEFVNESGYYRVKYENGKVEKLKKDRVSVGET